MFIGRKRELGTLDRCYSSGKFEFVTVYGRRRIGKTTLITEFCRDKKTILFPALETSAKTNLDMCGAAIAACTGGVRPALDSFQQALDHIAELAKHERIIFVIDEFPYLAASDRSVSSVLQNAIDHKFKDSKLMLILCGSSMSFMERQVLGYNSPLYGRRTAQIKLLPFSYDEVAKWFPSYTPDESAMVYAVLGGVPMYLEKFSEKKSVPQNILESVMSTDAVLFEEPSNLLKQELRDPRMYNAIVSAVAGGRTKLSEISSAVGMETGSVTKYIDNLISLGIVRKECPVLSKSSKRTVYQIADNFFRFWYRFVPLNTAAIISGNMPKIFDEAVMVRMNEFMGLAFEEICKDFVLRSDRIPFTVSKAGQWWGPDKDTRTQMQIDVVAMSHDGEEALFGACRYRNEQMTTKVLDELTAGVKAMNGEFSRTHYCLFSKSGFSASLVDAAKKEGILLFTTGDLYEGVGDQPADGQTR